LEALQYKILAFSAQGGVGCGAYHEAWWMGEPGYGAEVYEKREV